MRILTAFFITVALLATTSLYAQERIARADRKAMRETREEMRKLALDLRTLLQLNGEYPDELKSIVDANLREALPKDGWGNDFHYALSIEHGYKITSRGSDGEPGGENAARDIVWTRNGELRELTDEEQAALDAKRDEQRYQAFRLIAHERMVVVGAELVAHRRDKGAWPKLLEDFKPDGDNERDVVRAACFTDPWGNDFSFTLLPHDNFAVVCFGRDGEKGGSGRDADFVITEREVRAQYKDAAFDPWGGWNPNRDWEASDLADSVRQYKARHGKLPDELSDLTRGGQGEAIRFSIPTDSWGNEYIYVKLNDEEFYIASLGKDEIQGGIKDNLDTIHPTPGEIAEEEYWGEEPAIGLGGIKVEEVDENEVLVEVADEVMRNLCEQLNSYKEENGSYPEKLEDIADRLPGEVVPLDPWDNSFVYEVVADPDGNQMGFTLKCLGSDGAEGGEGSESDFSFNHELVRTPEHEEAEEE